MANASTVSLEVDESIVINPDVTGEVTTEEKGSSNSYGPHCKSNSTVTTVTTMTPTRTEVVKTTVTVTKETGANAATTRTTTKETSITTGTARLRTVEERTSIVPGDRELTDRAFDVF